MVGLDICGNALNNLTHGIKVDILYLDDDDSNSLRRSDLVSWYLREMESEIDSEAELLEKKTVLEKVLDRLVHHVSACWYIHSVFFNVNNYILNVEKCINLFIYVQTFACQ